MSAKFLQRLVYGFYKGLWSAHIKVLIKIIDVVFKKSLVDPPIFVAEFGFSCTGQYAMFLQIKTKLLENISVWSFSLLSCARSRKIAMKGVIPAPPAMNVPGP